MIELTTERVGNNNDDDDRRLLEMLLETMICLRRALCCRRSNMIGHNVDASFQRGVFVVWYKLWSENLFEFIPSGIANEGFTEKRIFFSETTSF